MNSFYKLLFITLFATQIAYSQNKISGTIADANGKALPFVTVGLLKTDSTIVKATTTDQNGHFEMNKVAASQYILKASYVGFQNYFSKSIEISGANIELPTVVLNENSTALNEVTVATKKAVFEQLIDRSVLNVANSIVGSGGTALDVIAQAPGITVDYQKDLIELRGKEGVLVQIDGKTTYLTGAELTGMLRGMSSDNIDKIELITNPSAKYDAAGNAGIINIRLKKSANLGTNGMFSMGLGAGVHYKSRSSLQLNHRTKKLNLFGNYGAIKGKNFWDLVFNREQPDGTLRNYIFQKTRTIYDDFTQNAKMGLDYSISKTASIGGTYTGAFVIREIAGPATLTAQRSLNQPIYLQTTTDKTENINSQNHLANINFSQSFKNKSNFSTDLDYGFYYKKENNGLNTKALILESGAEKPVPIVDNDKKTTVEIFTYKADFNKTLANKWKFEMGYKYGNVITKNNIKLLSGEANNLVLDPSLSNDFSYTEKINAGYFSLSGKINAVDFQAGLRAENTHSEGILSSPAQIKVRDYLDWFPSLFISKPVSPKETLIFSYSHRIDRPNYKDVNPSRFFVDLYAYAKGNIDLKPQYTHSLEIRYAHKNGFFASLSNNYVTDLSIAVNFVSEGNKLFRMTQNIGNSKGLAMTLSQPISFSKNWNTQATLNSFYNNFSFEYEGKNWTAKNMSARLNISNGIVLGKNWTAELNGWVNSPRINAIAQVPWLSNVDAGLQKTVSHKMKVKMSLTNLFFTPIVRTKYYGVNSFQSDELNMDTRVFLVNMTYTFGNQKVKAANQRKAGMEDENKRAN